MNTWQCLRSSIRTFRLSPRGQLVVAACLLFIQSIGLGTGEVYAANLSTFVSVSVIGLALRLGLLGIVFILCFLSLSFILPKKTLVMTAFLLVTISIITWLARFLTLPAGIQTDMSFALEQISPFKLIYRTLLVVGVGIIAWFSWRFRYRRRFIALAWFLALVNSLSLAYTLIVHPAPWSIRPELDYGHEFTLSKQKNILVFILDTMQSDAFYQLYRKTPEMQTGLKDFTFFPDTVGCFRETYPSIPCYLTGQLYRNEQKLPEYLTAAYAQKSLPLLLKTQDFLTDVYESPLGIPYDSGLFTSISRQPFNTVKMRVFATLVNTALYKSSPILIKKYYSPRAVENFLDTRIFAPIPKNTAGLPEDGFREFPDVRFAVQFINQAQVTYEQPAFKWYHLEGTHAPHLMGPDFKIQYVDINRQSYLTVARGDFHLMRLILDKLQTIGAYDNSTIIIAGDHGAYFPIGQDFSLLQDFPKLEKQPDSTKSPERGLPPAKTAGLPLLLIKPARTTQSKMAISPVSISMVDFGQIVQQVAQSGSLNNIPTHNDRLFLFSPIDKQFLSKAAFRGPLTEYRVKGFSWFPQSWENTHTVFQYEE